MNRVTNFLRRLLKGCGLQRSKQPRFIEVLSHNATFDSPIDHHFLGKPFHRAEDIGRYDVGAMIRALDGKVLRSRRDFMAGPSGLSRQLYWSNVLFRLDNDAFAYVQLNSNSYRNDSPVDETYRVTVTAAKPERALKDIESLRDRFRPKEVDTGTGFFLLTDDSDEIEHTRLSMAYRLSEEALALHYGEPFIGWSRDFLGSLASPGLTILRGDPGTGKTSFLRHAMCTLAETHRFYFVPVDSFGILTSGELTAFWKRQQREYPQAPKVLILEDAEALLSARDNNDERGAVSTLLNLTDGLMGDLVCLHLICTLNCKEDVLDPALLRPGRLRFYKNFHRLSFDQALRVARFHGLTLAENKDYSIAATTNWLRGELDLAPDLARRVRAERIGGLRWTVLRGCRTGAKQSGIGPLPRASAGMGHGHSRR